MSIGLRVVRGEGACNLVAPHELDLCILTIPHLCTQFIESSLGILKYHNHHRNTLHSFIRLTYPPGMLPATPTLFQHITEHQTAFQTYSCSLSRSRHVRFLVYVLWHRSCRWSNSDGCAAAADWRRTILLYSPTESDDGSRSTCGACGETQSSAGPKSPSVASHAMGTQCRGSSVQYVVHIFSRRDRYSFTQPPAHRPGEAMRVAHRRDDGGWEFSQPLTIQPVQFTPELRSACTSPTSSIATTTILRKEKKLPGELTTRGYVELDGEGLPPPAYTPR